MYYYFENNYKPSKTTTIIVIHSLSKYKMNKIIIIFILFNNTHSQTRCLQPNRHVSFE